MIPLGTVHGFETYDRENVSFHPHKLVRDA